MALGKAQKQKRNLQKIIQRKLDAKILTDEFYEDFKKTLDSKVDTYTHKDTKKEMKNEFKMYVYGHELLWGSMQTKDRWMQWIEGKRERLLNK